jgi:CHAD domain-containing protein
MAAAGAFKKLAREVKRESQRLLERADTEDIHDLRVATRRFRTALTIYDDATSKRDVRRVRRELERVADRLGAVRDLDVMLEGLAAGPSAGSADAGDDPLGPLRQAWVAERARAVRRLRAELERRRYRRFLDHAAELGRSARAARLRPGEPPLRVRDRAPAKIWEALGPLLAFDLGPGAPDPLAIHRMRIAAKGLRYTLEAFEDAIGGDVAARIAAVTALQDAAGKSHDAGVAATRAEAIVRTAHGVTPRERKAIQTYVARRRRDARSVGESRRRLAAVKRRAFRNAVSRRLVVM